MLTLVPVHVMTLFGNEVFAETIKLRWSHGNKAASHPVSRVLISRGRLGHRDADRAAPQASGPRNRRGRDRSQGAPGPRTKQPRTHGPEVVPKQGRSGMFAGFCCWQPFSLSRQENGLSSGRRTTSLLAWTHFTPLPPRLCFPLPLSLLKKILYEALFRSWIEYNRTLLADENVVWLLFWYGPLEAMKVWYN